MLLLLGYLFLLAPDSTDMLLFFLLLAFKWFDLLHWWRYYQVLFEISLRQNVELEVRDLWFLNFGLRRIGISSKMLLLRFKPGSTSSLSRLLPVIGMLVKEKVREYRAANVSAVLARLSLRWLMQPLPTPNGDLLSHAGACLVGSMKQHPNSP